MRRTPSTIARPGESPGDLAAWLLKNAENNDAQMERLKKNLLRAMDEDLTPRQREMLSMLYFGGYRQSEIAEILGVNRSTVCRVVKSAENKLAKMLKYSF